jgi:uncharacterized protein (TIGR02996 family)
MREQDVSEALLSALDADRGDVVSQAALADWFDEQGDAQAAECLRWVVRNRRRPGHYPAQDTYGSYFWELQEPAPLLNDPPAQLPEALWNAVGDNDEPHPVGSFKSYGSPQAAYRALVAGWKRLGRPAGDVA